ncbi:SDR family oxidoreductase [Reichenbachiella sp. MALMAid0571]|uniref:SDR family oxidoreductase n=1 Tax=Reichenbachiella sp. MALMAid0571 TaxID=3143939 RepID=UPI0032DECC1D
MKILITGSNGLLGQKLVGLLLTKGVKVIATGIGTDRTNNNSINYTYTQLDITNQEEVEQVIGHHEPDVVVNTAAMTNVDQCETEKKRCRKLNVDAVRYIVEACETNDTFLIHLSTDFIFDGENGPYKEGDIANPISFYGESKLDAEEIVIKSKTKWAILRTVLVYGVVPSMSRSNIILWVKDSIENKKNIKVVTDQWRTPTLAEDLAMGCYLTAIKKETGIFNISGKDMLTPYDMAIKTANYFNLDQSFIAKADSTTFSQTAKRPAKTGFTIDKAISKLGYEPHSFDEGIAILDGQMKELQKIQSERK